MNTYISHSSPKTFSNVANIVLILLVSFLLYTGCVTLWEEKVKITLSVSTNTLDFASTNEQKQFTINSNYGWTINIENSEWLTASRTSGTDNEMITVTARSNTSLDSRVSKITVKSDFIEGVPDQVINVTQLGVKPFLDVSTDSLKFTALDGEKSLSIKSNTHWMISNNDSWLWFSDSLGNGNKTITVYIDENTSVSPRNTILTFKSGDLSRNVQVIQEGRKSSIPVEFGNNIEAASRFEVGNGTENNPWRIYNAQELKKLVKDVNNGNNYEGKYFKLMTDIYVSAKEWNPIGYGYVFGYYPDPMISFNGNFNGNGYCIYGSLNSNSNDCPFLGFFGVLGKGANISNMIINATINQTSIFSFTGAIAGDSNGNVMISNCHIQGLIKSRIESCCGGIIGACSGTIKNCTVSCHITGGGGTQEFTGGIVGNLYKGEIINCIVTKSASVTGNDPYGECMTGGIAGKNSGKISNCTNNAIVTGATSDGGGVAEMSAGGIAGHNSGEIINCTNNANVYGMTGALRYQDLEENLKHLFTGGLAGYNSGVIHSSRNIGNVTDQGYNTGGLAGYNDFDTNVHVYSCCSNNGRVNNSMANEKNRIGAGKAVETCKDGH